VSHLSLSRAPVHGSCVAQVPREVRRAHPESKFENGESHGTMRRRHFRVKSTHHIGKEANDLEETRILGANEETYVEYREIPPDDSKVRYM